VSYRRRRRREEEGGGGGVVVGGERGGDVMTTTVRGQANSGEGGGERRINDYPHYENDGPSVPLLPVRGFGKF